MTLYVASNSRGKYLWFSDFPKIKALVRELHFQGCPRHSGADNGVPLVEVAADGFRSRPAKETHLASNPHDSIPPFVRSDDHAGG